MVWEFLGLGVTSWLAVGVATLLLWLTSRKPRGLPPGPALCLPVVGHLPLMRGDPCHVLTAMRKQYGDVFHLYLGSQLTVVLCGYDVMKEALVKNADVFSDRPRGFFFDVICRNNGIVASSGPKWKEHRKFAFTALKEFGFGRNILQEKILEEISVFTEAIAQEKGRSFDVRFLTGTAVSNIICNIVLGKRFDYEDQTFVSFLEAMDKVASDAVSAGLVSFIPILKYIPGDLCKSRQLAAGIDRTRTLLMEPAIEHHLKTFDPTQPCKDFIDAYIREIKKHESEETPTTMDNANLLESMMDLFSAGTETTSTTLRWSFIYLLNFPEIQERLYAEIQDKIGAQPPRVEDRTQMPFVNAFMQEVLRHADIVPLSIAHQVSQDTVFRGFHLPRGTMVIPFLDSALKDPAVWKDPEEFRPDRFLKDGQLLSVEELVPFSLGRRVCLGESLARMEIFLFLVTLVQRFRFVCPEDSSLPKMRGVLGIVHSPNSFLIKALPRA